MLRFIQTFFTLPMKVIFPTKIKGKENLKGLKKQGAIIASNHTSNMDAVIFALNTWEKKYYLAKKELFKNKLFGGIIKSIGAVKIDRGASDITSIKTCLKLLKENKKLVIFPEGTRNKNSENMELGEVKHGTAMFAIKAKVPILPMFISRKPKAFKKTQIILGKPFTLEEFYGRKLDSTALDECAKIIAEKMNELREEFFKNDKKSLKKENNKIKSA
jgi:1-acyl-sn-glycerol-3-phosphate acyltransferase